MNPTDGFTHLTHILQASIAPVILVSGIGLLLLSLTNRLGRLIDRSRQLAREMPSAKGSQRTQIDAQISVIFQRARYLKFATLMSGLGILLLAVLIIGLFLCSLLALDGSAVIVVLFVSILLCLICSMSAFLLEVNLSLEALKVELGERRLAGSKDHPDP
ncbi:MAG: DUF2721 domain-containing protein [Candidatus Methylacidiphilales bacterium]|nr:DUF2721 domain-containing protein [Candidatus Methylacidiphilales bacterium]